jgi:hypothetical protein
MKMCKDCAIALLSLLILIASKLATAGDIATTQERECRVVTQALQYLQLQQA